MSLCTQGGAEGGRGGEGRPGVSRGGAGPDGAGGGRGQGGQQELPGAQHKKAAQECLGDTVLSTTHTCLQASIFLPKIFKKINKQKINVTFN